LKALQADPSAQGVVSQAKLKDPCLLA
ncbi:MAG: hypothetical protein K1000chlam3_01205, partial [Chlamydiae bacterium]|nr:hypothetical protein [Chlamydiota bacterium]NGX47820.1 hypothetical protein [Chlamydiota bacterium]